jgi:threonine/homoserine/homoserine lactone efflux protein
MGGMELLTRLPTFLVAVLLIAAVPGPAFALIVRRSSIGGLRAGAPVVLGIEAGLYFWIIAAGAGLAALVAASHVAFLLLRISSAVVLL